MHESFGLRIGSLTWFHGFLTESTGKRRTPVATKSSLALACAATLLSGCGGALDAILDGGDFGSKAGAMYVVRPSLESCQAGALQDAVKEEALNTVNALRRLHGLGEVRYDASSDDEVMQAALMMAANGSLEHNPPSTWKCYSASGALGASTSNLTLGSGRGLALVPTRDDVVGWYTDVANAIPSNVGHRRWILDPFLDRVAYGRVAAGQGGTGGTDASALKVVYPAGVGGARIASDFVAYPTGEFPAQYFDAKALFSFSVVVDNKDRAANARVDFSKAQVLVVDPQGRTKRVFEQSFDNVGYGLPNNLQFRVDGIEVGVQYSVRVDKVGVPGATRAFEYAFRIVR